MGVTKDNRTAVKIRSGRIRYFPPSRRECSDGLKNMRESKYYLTHASSLSIKLLYKSKVVLNI